MPTERGRPLRARIGHDEADPAQVWISGSSISAEEFHFLTALHAWAVAHAPHLPEANPRQKIDLGSMPSLF